MSKLAPDPAVWLLDVDGVVNADRPGSPWRCAPWRATVYAGMEFRLRWAPLLTRRIRLLIASGAVEVRWCTTWCPWAEVLEEKWGWPKLERALTDAVCSRSTRGISEAKVEAALDVARSGRRLIWTDDVVVPTQGALRERLTAHGRGLLIAPESRFGLTPAHMDQIEKFAGVAGVLPA